MNKHILMPLRVGRHHMVNKDVSTLILKYKALRNYRIEILFLQPDIMTSSNGNIFRVTGPL